MNLATKDIPEYIYHYLQSAESDKSCILQDKVVQAFKEVEQGLETDVVQATKSLDTIILQSEDVSLNTEETLLLIKSWHDGKACFSTTSMVAYAIKFFSYNIEDHKAYIDALLVAGILADVKNDLPYHNTLHFRKVLLHVIRMIAAHNALFKGSGNVLNHDEISKLIISACIHDFGHEGTGNIIDRKYNMAMTEKKSFDLALPYLQSTELGGAIISDIRVMLMTTDVSPFGDPISPVNQARVAYEYHFGMVDSDDEFELSDELAVLREDDRLCLLCVMLHEADIMNSAGVHYDITCAESVAISEELGEDGAFPEDTLLFLQKICNNGMLSGAARFLADENLANIKNRVMDDFRNGNKSYR